MIKNLEAYFEPEHVFYLDDISYKRIEKNEQAKEHELNCIDNIEVELLTDGLRLTVCRTLKFKPEEIFHLSVSFGALLRFGEKKDEINWNEIDLPGEFRENGQFVLGNLMNRMSMLIADITASFGQTPIILPPGIAKKRREQQ